MGYYINMINKQTFIFSIWLCIAGALPEKKNPPKQAKKTREKTAPTSSISCSWTVLRGKDMQPEINFLLHNKLHLSGKAISEKMSCLSNHLAHSFSHNLKTQLLGKIVGFGPCWLQCSGWLHSSDLAAHLAIWIKLIGQKWFPLSPYFFFLTMGTSAICEPRGSEH